MLGSLCVRRHNRRSRRTHHIRRRRLPLLLHPLPHCPLRLHSWSLQAPGTPMSSATGRLVRNGSAIVQRCRRATSKPTRMRIVKWPTVSSMHCKPMILLTLQERSAASVCTPHVLDRGMPRMLSLRVMDSHRNVARGGSRSVTTLKDAFREAYSFRQPLSGFPPKLLKCFDGNGSPVCSASTKTD